MIDRFCAVTILALLLVPGSLSAQSATDRRLDAFVGTWTMNLAKSTYSPAPAPQSQVTTLELAGDGLRMIDDTVTAQGERVHSDRVERLDGQAYPVPDRGTGDTRTYTWIDDHTIQVVNTRNGNVTTARNVISRDGKTRTFSTTGKDAQGRSVNNVVVYDKQ
jgi:hypothetical protein